MGGYLGGSRGTAYAASKFAVAGFTESLALELEEFGITATIVGPGYFRSDFLDKSSAILEPATLIADYRASNAAFRAATETANHAQQGDPNASGLQVGEDVHDAEMCRTIEGRGNHLPGRSTTYDASPNRLAQNTALQEHGVRRSNRGVELGERHVHPRRVTSDAGLSDRASSSSWETDIRHACLCEHRFTTRVSLASW